MLRLLLILVVIGLFVIVLTRLLRGKGSTRDPGREEPKLLRQGTSAVVAMEHAHDIVRVLAGNDPLPHAEIDLAASDPSAFSARAIRDWNTALDATPTSGEAAAVTLTWHGYISGIDHRSAPDELKDALDPLLSRAGVADFDWSFIDRLEESEDWEALKNNNLLPIVAANVAKRGAVMIFINPGTGDNFEFAVGSREQYQRLLSLRCEGFNVSDEHVPW